MRSSLYGDADTIVTCGSLFSWGHGNFERTAAYFRVLGFHEARAFCGARGAH